MTPERACAFYLCAPDSCRCPEPAHARIGSKWYCADHIERARRAAAEYASTYSHHTVLAIPIRPGRALACVKYLAGRGARGATARQIAKRVYGDIELRDSLAGQVLASLVRRGVLTSEKREGLLHYYIAGPLVPPKFKS